MYFSNIMLPGIVGSILDKCMGIWPLCCCVLCI